MFGVRENGRTSLLEFKKWKTHLIDLFPTEDDN